MSDLLTRLIEAGTPGHLVAEVARELARAEVEREAIEARRAADRERQARRRHNVMSRDIADVTECHSEPLSRPPNENNSNPPTHTPENNTTRARLDPFPKPDFVDAGVWTDFLANRKAKRLPNTASAHAKLLRDVETWAARTGWPPGDVLRACVERGWGAIYDFTEQKNGQPKQSNHRGGSTRDAAQLALSRMGHG